MIERFNTDPVAPLTKDYFFDSDNIERTLPSFIEIADTGTAGDVNTIRHALGHVPRGMKIINVVVASTPTNEPSWYRLADDDAWNETEMNVRFTEDNMHVLLEVI